MEYNIYNGVNIITSIDEGDIEYPYEKEAQLIFKNEGLNPFVNVSISIHYGLSIKNYSIPTMIADAQQISFDKPKKKYYELLMKKTGKISDMANFPSRVIDVIIDSDGWCRNVIENIAIKFNSLQQGGNASIYFSDAKFLAGLSKDYNSASGVYSNKIRYDIIYPGQSVPFWYKFKLKENLKGEINPRLFNIVVEGEEGDA